MKAAVVGAGIGGAAAALALARTGWSVTVFERAEALGAVGAGLQLGPNAMRVLASWGVRARGMRPTRVEMRDGPGGRLQAVIPFGDEAEARYGAAYQQFHRQDLLAALVAAARDAGVAFEFGAKVTPKATPQADLIVAADGIRSMFRTHLNPGVEAAFTGQVAWRALVPQADLTLSATQLWMGPGRHVVAYPLREGAVWNVVAVQERSHWATEGWHNASDPGELRTAFAGWRLAGLLDQAEEVILWGLFAHGPLPQWHRGHIGLLGDACHPMLPFMAQGAAMAIEDAWVLADCLRSGAVADGLARYQARRRPRTSRVQAVAARNARIYHLRSGLARGARGLGLNLARRAQGGLLARFDWLYGADVTASP